MICDKAEYETLWIYFLFYAKLECILALQSGHIPLQIWPYVDHQGQQPRIFYFIHDWIGENVYAVIFALGLKLQSQYILPYNGSCQIFCWIWIYFWVISVYFLWHFKFCSIQMFMRFFSYLDLLCSYTILNHKSLINFHLKFLGYWWFNKICLILKSPLYFFLCLDLQLQNQQTNNKLNGLKLENIKPTLPIILVYAKYLF